jgi:signal transduction histidine kinase/CheY-like chemotaxis protein
MFEAIQRSVRRKLMFVVLATTFAALSVAASALIVYDLATYRDSSIADVRTQADIVARASAPALAFDDPKAAAGNLALLQARPQIVAAALYDAKGRLFASYPPDLDSGAALPTAPRDETSRIDGDVLSVFHPIVEKGERVGTVYVRARYQLAARLIDYLGIIGVAMIASLLVAWLVSSWLQSTITDPILAVTRASREVMARRDFSQRVTKTSDDEVGYLVDTFNAMLAEVGRRSQALEASNRELSHEMGERRAAEEALRAADRRKDEFLATLAHELRNPLAPMRNALHVLRGGAVDPSVSRDARDMIDRQLRQMVRLVDDLLDVSRISTGKLVLHRDRVALAEVVGNAIETIRPLIDERGHRLNVELPAEPVWLDADATRLAQVFANLLNNAAKYTNSGGSIELNARREGDMVEVAVCDNGIGIAPEMVDEIFSMFAQVDHSLERAHAGLGVGLTLAKRLVEMHGGTIAAASAGLGRGSEFRVRLPLAAAAGTAASDRSVPAASRAERRRVLIVDDNRDFASSLALLLGALGQDVDVAYDGPSAIARAERFAPHVVFLDIGLPGINGYDVARRLRAIPATADAVITAVTGWGQDHDRARAFDAGFDYHVVKPLDPDQLEMILERGRNRTAPPDERGAKAVGI